MPTVQITDIYYASTGKSFGVDCDAAGRPVSEVSPQGEPLRRGQKIFGISSLRVDHKTCKAQARFWQIKGAGEGRHDALHADVYYDMLWDQMHRCFILQMQPSRLSRLVAQGFELPPDRFDLNGRILLEEAARHRGRLEQAGKLQEQAKAFQDENAALQEDNAALNAQIAELRAQIEEITEDRRVQEELTRNPRLDAFKARWEHMINLGQRN